ncbi:hypothetical protein Dip510_000086 [Elusimicrobium posterum]|uniref:hypothetical protein n=1 Tax=Elusimicrobium posterum TaxID=3116653 RepID=UPI003C78674B
MKKLIPVFLFIFALAVTGCGASAQKTDESKKLYIEEGEYDATLTAEAQNERRGAKPVVESNYIFRVLPKDTYFYNEKNIPIEDEVRTAGDYKAERLWKRPKRYKPGEYTKTSVAGSATDGSYENSSYYD